MATSQKKFIYKNRCWAGFPPHRAVCLFQFENESQESWVCFLKSDSLMTDIIQIPMDVEEKRRILHHALVCVILSHRPFDKHAGNAWHKESLTMCM